VKYFTPLIVMSSLQLSLGAGESILPRIVASAVAVIMRKSATLGEAVCQAQEVALVTPKLFDLFEA
jgi:hypothetical protein